MWGGDALLRSTGAAGNPKLLPWSDDRRGGGAQLGDVEGVLAAVGARIMDAHTQRTRTVCSPPAHVV
jgi:hypothetical protein